MALKIRHKNNKIRPFYLFNYSDLFIPIKTTTCPLEYRRASVVTQD
jgi:hypothetical protein